MIHIHFCQCFTVILTTFLILQFQKTVSTECELLYDKYPGFPDCRKQMERMKIHWQDPDVKDIYKAAGVDGTWCSFQRYYANVGHICPDPDWLDGSDGRLVHSDGSQSFKVYRAINSKNAYTLLNENGADIGGILSYLHTEIVPEYQRNEEEVGACSRKSGIDVVIIFNVTVKTPAWVQEKYDDIFGMYSIFNEKKCTGNEEVCDFENIDAYLPGSKVEPTSSLHRYPSNVWYSFPACGFCKWPTGDKYCTYTYEVIGKLWIDDIVGISTDISIPTAHRGSRTTPIFFDLCKIGGTEYQTSIPSSINNCDHPDSSYPNTIKGIDYWYSPCDKRMNIQRMERLAVTHVDTSAKQPGTPPEVSFCPSAKYNSRSATTNKKLNSGAIVAIVLIIIIILSLTLYYLCTRSNVACFNVLYRQKQLRMHGELSDLLSPLTADDYSEYQDTDDFYGNRATKPYEPLKEKDVALPTKHKKEKGHTGRSRSIAEVSKVDLESDDSSSNDEEGTPSEFLQYRKKNTGMVQMRGVLSNKAAKIGRSPRRQNT